MLAQSVVVLVRMRLASPFIVSTRRYSLFSTLWSCKSALSTIPTILQGTYLIFYRFYYDSEYVTERYATGWVYVSLFAAG